jgi:DNA-binding MarR family transcriptional regulator
MGNIEEVLIALRRIIRATDLQSKFLARTTGLTVPQLLLLQAIGNNADAAIGELAKAINLSQATVTTIVDRLEKKTLLFRRRSEQDKRKVFIYLTNAGKAALSNAPTPLQEHFVKRFGELPDWEQSMILSSLQRIGHMMDAADIDASPFIEVGELDKPSPKGLEED